MQLAPGATTIPDTDPLKDSVGFQSFYDGLGKASLCVGLIANGKTKAGVCTGWLITNNLVVVPDYIDNIVRRNGVECYFFNAEKKLITSKGKVIYTDRSRDMNNMEDLKSSLIRLQKPVRNAAAILNMNSLDDINRFYFLHFPYAKLPLQLSVSNFISRSERLLEYNASSVGGSGGAPLFSFDGRVIGMHFGVRDNVKLAFSLRAVIADLQQSRFWNEIADFHGLPGIKTAAQIKREKDKATRERNKRHALLSKYALRWNFNPSVLSEQQKEQLIDYVMETSDAKHWTLEDEFRIRFINQLGTLPKMRAARGKTVINHPGQQVIDTILKGRPVKIQKLDEASLPYWLQAVTWFREVLPSLPSAQEISAELQRRRHHSRLVRSAGPEFRGRTTELAKLDSWYHSPDAGAMIISGIGGIGKSALISTFALGLKDTMLFWLDFDRADIAPDNAMSVLRILNDQLSFQSASPVTIDLNTKDWGPVTDQLATSLQRDIKAGHPALIILDGFEVAQHSKKYNEIWPLLERLLVKAPDVRVIISGRSAVKQLNLRGRKPSFIQLEGLEKEEAKQWLKHHGITAAAPVEQICKISRGIPLILKLAARFIDEGGKMSALTAKLPQVAVEGFLYQRIYNRVINQKLRNTVKDILVLRVISPDILREVLRDNLPHGISAEDAFESILREMSLVPEAALAGESALPDSSATSVNVRPEVRAPSIKLLEMQDEKRVRMINQRAIRYYEKIRRPKDSEEIELIYHYLRAGKLAEAKKRWKPDYIEFLEDNIGDIPDKYSAAKEWLQSKTSAVPENMTLADWEADASRRIRGAISHGQMHVIAGILKERNGRTGNSPLAIYDAWYLWKDKRSAEKALAKLDTDGVYEPTMSPEIYYDQQVVAAKIAYQQGDEARASDILYSLREVAKKNLDTFKFPTSMVSLAPRITFAAKEQLKKEIGLLDLFNSNRRTVRDVIDITKGMLSFFDFILPELRLVEFNSSNAPKMPPLIVPESNGAKDKFRDSLGSIRKLKSSKLNAMGKLLGSKEYNHDQLRRLILNDVRMMGKDREDVLMAGEIATLAWQRWHFALTGFWIDNFIRLVGSEDPRLFKQAFASTAAYASFRAVTMISMSRKVGPVQNTQTDKFVENIMRKFNSKFPGEPIYVKHDDLGLALKYLSNVVSRDKKIRRFYDKLTQQINFSSSNAELSLVDLLSIENASIRTVLFILLMPNPIDVMGNDVLGFPYIFANEEYLSQKRFS